MDSVQPEGPRHAANGARHSNTEREIEVSAVLKKRTEASDSLDDVTARDPARKLHLLGDGLA
jgi:hypothetical protein